MPRYDRFSLEKKKVEIYSDIPTNLDKHPVTKFLAKVINEESVKQSIRNLIQTRRGERFYDSKKGSTVFSALFDQFTEITVIQLKQSIEEVINIYEPRAQFIDAIIRDNPDSNEINIRIVFSLVKIPDEQYTLDVTVNRIR